MSSPDDAGRKRWGEVEPILDRALDLPPGERGVFLDAACAGDPDLRARVEALLRADAEAASFLDTPALEQSAPLVAAQYEDPMAGRLVGPYRILRESGRGGMGVVYLAERADGQFQQRVALKLIKRGMDSDAILQRFLHERQILARLEHPNIARLLDGGVTGEGQPWFAMEHVTGRPLTTHCDERRLGIDARLRLFVTACAAVQYAHQNLVVHRDLKPGNMLVTESGDLKLVDFGIAKVLGGEPGAAGSAPLTEIGTRPMTPEYAAPEQLRGEPATTAVDVYALGVVLYELLSGRRPHGTMRGDPAALARVAVTEPLRPSTAVLRPFDDPGAAAPGRAITPLTVGRDRGMRPERLRRRLAGDLDTICLMALRNESGRRYASVQVFLDDIRRHLSGLPVLARPDTLGYRASRFVRRHRISVAATITIALILVGFTAVTAVQSARIREQASRIARERDKAEEVVDFVLSLFEVSNPLVETMGDLVTARDLLERGVERIDAELTGQPEVQAELMTVIGQAYQEMGRYDRAGTLLERALVLRRQALGDEHLDVARSMRDLATLLRLRGEYAAAESLNRDALALQRRLLGDENLEVANSLNNLGVALRLKGDLAGAEPLYREALAIWRRLLGEDAREVLTSMNNLAVLLHQKRDFDEAERLHLETLAARRRVLGIEHPHVAVTLNNMGWMYQDKGDLAAAERSYREALAMQQRLLGPEHPSVALTMHNLATVLIQQDRIDDAAPLAEDSLAMRRRLLGGEHVDVATSLKTLAMIHIARHELETAERLTHEALDLLRKALPEGHVRLASTLVTLGRIRLDRGRPEEATPLLQEALEIRRQKLGPTHPAAIEIEDLLSGVSGSPRR